MSYVDDGDRSYGIDSAPDDPTSDEAQFYGEPTASAFGFALEHLRILSGPICDHCWTSDGEIVPGTEEQCDPWGYIHGHLCESCNDREPDDSDFYGGSGPSEQDRFEARRDSGRRS